MCRVYLFPRAGGYLRQLEQAADPSSLRLGSSATPGLLDAARATPPAASSAGGSYTRPPYFPETHRDASENQPDLRGEERTRGFIGTRQGQEPAPAGSEIPAPIPESGGLSPERPASLPEATSPPSSAGRAHTDTPPRSGHVAAHQRTGPVDPPGLDPRIERKPQGRPDGAGRATIRPAEWFDFVAREQIARADRLNAEERK